MTINLKQIRVLDTNNIKLDKINYNFDQLIVNGGGPKGYNGPDGPLGPQGFQGALGNQGDRGPQGPQGPDASSSSSYWDVVPQNLTTGDVAATLFSKHPIGSPTPTFPTVVGAGYIDSENGYDAIPSPNNGLPNYQWIINRRSAKVSSNLRFTSAGVIGNAFDITMDNSAPISSPTTYKLRLGFINDTIDSQLNLQAKEHIIRSVTGTGADLLKVSNTGGEINVDTVFENPVKLNQQLTVKNSGEGVNKVAAAIDSTGEIEFKTTAELGGSVKIGTIISILPSIFSDSSKFVCAQTIDSSTDPNNPLKIRMGAGLGDYAGWYVCNGQSWTDGSSSGTLVPDLNSFSYQIVSNPITDNLNSQGTVNVTNDEVHLIGGANIEVVVDQTNPPGSSSAMYVNTLDDNSFDPEIATNTAGNIFNIKKLPQIIYLGSTNLYWSQLGTGQLTTSDYNSSDYNVADFDAS